MSKVEEVAARLWKAESEDAGVPASIANGRTLEAFRDQSDKTRARWFKFARAAIEAMREPTQAMIDSCGDGECSKWAPGAWAAYIDAALREEGR